jgi:hypothetical protein
VRKRRANSPTVNKESRPEWLKVGLLSAITVDLLGFTGAGVGLGYWAWSRWGAPWWVLLLCSMAGLSAAMYRLYLLSKKDFL